MTKGKMAPPTIPVTMIPANDPWCSVTELRASEKMMGYMTDAKKPTSGKAIKEVRASPNRAKANEMMARKVKADRTIRLSNNFSNAIPKIPPAVINPQ